MADNEKKPILHVLPAVLTGAAALIASLTAVYVNVRNDREAAADRPAAAVAASPRDTPAKPAAAAPPAPVAQTLDLRLNRIAVEHDGAIGTSDWRFAVEADGQPLFVFGLDDLDDTGGRNVVVPDKVGGSLELMPGTRAKIAIKAWRNRRLRLTEGPPDAIGEGSLSASGAIAPLHVAADEPDKGAFVFYFSATPEK